MRTIPLAALQHYAFCPRQCALIHNEQAWAENFLTAQGRALHERVDGGGYPHALCGDQISHLARMAVICDVYDAVTSNRAYKAPWNPAGAMRQMAQWEGHFDQAIFSAFVKAVGIYPVGALVRLASKRLAVVVEPGTQSLLKPKVRVFFSLRTNEPIPLQVIDLAAADYGDSIAGPEDPGQWKFSNLDDLWRP